MPDADEVMTFGGVDTARAGVAVDTAMNREDPKRRAPVTDITTGYRRAVGPP